MESLCQHWMLVSPDSCRRLSSCSQCILTFSVFQKSVLGDYIHAHIHIWSRGRYVTYFILFYFESYDVTTQECPPELSGALYSITFLSM